MTAVRSNLAPDDGRPRRPCPVCGHLQLVSNLGGHVGSERCLAELARRDGKHHDPKRGPRIVRLARELDALLSADAS